VVRYADYRPAVRIGYLGACEFNPSRGPSDHYASLHRFFTRYSAAQVRWTVLAVVITDLAGWRVPHPLR